MAYLHILNLILNWDVSLEKIIENFYLLFIKSRSDHMNDILFFIYDYKKYTFNFSIINNKF